MADNTLVEVFLSVCLPLFSVTIFMMNKDGWIFGWPTQEGDWVQAAWGKDVTGCCSSCCRVPRRYLSAYLTEYCASYLLTCLLSYLLKLQSIAADWPVPTYNLATTKARVCERFAKSRYLKMGLLEVRPFDGQSDAPTVTSITSYCN